MKLTLKIYYNTDTNTKKIKLKYLNNKNPKILISQQL